MLSQSSSKTDLTYSPVVQILQTLFFKLPLQATCIRQKHKFKAEMGLPVELWEHIISFLPPDALALFACLLTCKGFHALAEKEKAETQVFIYL